MELMVRQARRNFGVRLAGLLLCAALANAEAISNAVWIRATDKGSTRRRPVTISRVFARGEISQYAQAAVDGTPVPTQCNVKTRWGDGSVQQAILSFWITLKPGGVRVEFVEQPSPHDQGALTKDELLGFNGGQWGAAIEAAAVVPGSRDRWLADVRQMLEDWNGSPDASGVRYWLKGPICTQVIVEDRTPALRYDFGWKSTLKPGRLGADASPEAEELVVREEDADALKDWQPPLAAYVDLELVRICSIEGNRLQICRAGRGQEGTRPTLHRAWMKPLIVPDQGWQAATEDRYRSLHPIFVLTFYPGWEGVKVDYIVENDWTGKLQDQTYTATLYNDRDRRSTVFRGRVIHIARTRWRKTYWSGSAPDPIQVDYNLPYLIQSRLLPSFDLSKKVSGAAIRDTLARFQRKGGAELNKTGQLNQYFGTTGDRPEIGLFPRWTLRYLYTFDPRLEDVVLGNATVSGYVPIHYRESETRRRFTHIGDFTSTSGFGRVISVDGRPTFTTLTLTARETNPDDRIEPVGPMTDGGWRVDRAHQPSLVFLPYMLTGDWYFLQELYFWAAYDVGGSNPRTCSYCRHWDWGYIADQSRGEAWALRNLAFAAVAAPDGSPEKAYFTEKLNNNIAVKEGKYNIRHGAFYRPCATQPYDESREPSMWCWGRNTVAGGRYNPLLFLDSGSSRLRQGTRTDRVAAASSPWSYNFNHIVWGYLKELGFRQIAPLQETMAKNLLHQICDPDYNPYLVDSYRIPVRQQAEGTPYFTRWGTVKEGFLDESREKFEHVMYAWIALAASSFLPGINDGSLSGTRAWEFMRDRVPGQNQLNDDPRFALVPRGEQWQRGKKQRPVKLPAWQSRGR